MVKTPLRSEDIGNEPTPIFASATDIAFAEALRQKLEARYFGLSASDAPLPGLSGEVH